MPDIPPSILPAEGFVRFEKVMLMYPFSRTTIWRMIKDGTFPQPKKISPRLNVWDVQELREFQRRISEGEVAL